MSQQLIAFQPLEETKVVALMVAGAFFALAGLYLLFRRPAEVDAARIELFGMKFRASSTGLVVFLIGAGLLGAPLLVPPAPPSARPDMPAVAPPGAVSVPPEAGQPRAPEHALESAGGVPASIAKWREAEPNNSVDQATRIEAGTFSGIVGEGDQDWYVFTPDEQKGDQFRVKARAVKGGVLFGLSEDADEARVGRYMLSYFTRPKTSTGLSIPVEYFLHFMSGQEGTNAYEFTIDYP